jgi:hypothetical protein
MVSSVPRWGGGGISACRSTSPQFLKVLRYFCVKMISGIIWIFYSFFSFSQYVCLCMSFHISYLCRIWFWGSSFSIHECLTFSGQRAQRYRLDVEISTLRSRASSKFSPYLKENTTLHHYKDQPVKLFEEMIAVHSESHTKPVKKTKCRITDY